LGDVAIFYELADGNHESRANTKMLGFSLLKA